MVSLRINGIDFTQFITEDSYSVYPMSVFEEWEDADVTFHEGEYRQRIVGEFELKFISDTDYNSFISNIAIASNGRLTTLEVYVGGLVNDMVQSNFFCTITSSSKRDANANRVVNTLKMQIKEQ